MKKYLLLTSVVLTGAAIGGAYAAIDCSIPPSCSELGYNKTASECGNLPKLKCPFGENYFCALGNGSSTEPEEIPEEVKEVNCESGSILYDDFKCYTGFPTDKVPLGVVFDDENKLAVTFDEGSYTFWSECKTNDYYNWCRYTATDSPLTNCSSAEGCNSLGVCNSYLSAIRGEQQNYGHVLDVCKTAGHDPETYTVFLPSAKELLQILAIKDQFNEALKQVRKHYSSRYFTDTSDEIRNKGFYWSSDEANRDYSIAVTAATGNIELMPKMNLGSTRCAFYYESNQEDGAWLEEKCKNEWQLD